MKCPNCLGEWTPPQNGSLSKCPFCQTDILQALNTKTVELSPEEILRNLLQVYGLELLQQEQRLCAMIADLFAHDKRTKKMLLLSVKEKIPQQIQLITNSNEHELRLNALRLHLKEEAFLNDETATLITTIWQQTFLLEEPDDSFEIVWQRGYCGFRNSKGEMITPFKYDGAEDFRDNLALVKQNGKFGFINNEGFEQLPLIYTSASSFSDGLAFTYKESFKECILFRPNFDGEKMVYEEETDFERIDDYNYINYEGETVFHRDTEGDAFSEGLARAYESNKCGYINTKGEIVIDFKFDRVWDFKDGIALVKISNNCYSFINKEGIELIPTKFGYAEEFSDGLALVSSRGAYGFINQNGDVVIPIKYEDAGSFSNNLAPVMLKRKYGFINKAEEVIIQFIYDDAKPFMNGVSYVRYGDTYGFINLEGQPVSEFKYSFPMPEFAFGVSRIQSAETRKYGLINNCGKEISALKYDNIGIDHDPWSYVMHQKLELFKDGLVVAEINGKYGFLGINGEEVIPLIYEDVEPFGARFKGLSKVKLSGRSYYINKIGKEISIEKYCEFGEFVDGFLKVKSKNYGFVDYQWKEITALIYEDIENFKEGLALIKINNKYGFVNNQGAEIITPKYGYASSFEKGKAEVELNGKRGLIDKKGNWISALN